MKEAPKEMTLASLSVLVMPNGEVLCAGKTLGWVTTEPELGKQLSNFKSAITSQPVNEKGELL